MEQANTQVVKNFIDSKEICLQMFKQNYQALKTASTSKIDKAELCNLYGMYYCSFFALLRTGYLCERKYGKNGFPNISILIENEEYLCPESILFGINPDEAEEIISPWQNSGQSYLSVNTYDMYDNPKQPVIEDEEKDKSKTTKSISNIDKERYEKQILILQKKYDNLLKQQSKNKGELSEKEYTTQLNKIHQAEIKELKNSYNAKINELSKEIKATNNKYNSLMKTNKTQISQNQELIKKIEYDPNYDHYYSDILPELLESLNFAKTDIIIRCISIFLACAFIILSGIFVL